MFLLHHAVVAILGVVIVISLYQQFYSGSIDYRIDLSAKLKPRPRLSLSKGKNSFNIVIFSDLHYGEDEATFGPEQDRKSTKVIGKILDFEEPDFVVISKPLQQGLLHTCFSCSQRKCFDSLL